MKVGILGLGSIGSRHAANVVALGHEGIGYDPAKPEADCRGTLDRIVNEADAVMICTPATTHASIARWLNAAGYLGALFCEKPLALSVEDCDVFLKWTHPTTMVGYMLRHHERAAALRAVVPAPDSISCRMDCDVLTWPGHDYAAFIYEASHEIDLALWFGGTPTVVSAEIRQDRARLRGPNWDVTLNGCAQQYCREWSASNRALGYHNMANSPQELGDSMYLSELAHFLDCAARGVPTMTPFADGLRVLDVIAQAQKLAQVPA